MKDRIKKIMDNNNLSSAQFADKIGVTRSSLSHVLSGRNNASLDYVLKIIQAFPQIDSNWLLTGEGISNSKTNSITDNTDNQDASMEKLQNSFSNVNKKIAKGKKEFIKEAMLDDTSEDQEKYETLSPIQKQVYQKSNSFNSDLEKIVFFYKDGSFKVFSSR